jgi:hypothetical protein
MAKNAAMLQEALRGSDKVVVFSGAMVPLSMAQQHGSDAVHALKFTLEHIREQSSGVHMVGRDASTKRLTFFDPSTVEKNKAASLETLTFSLNRR